MIPLCPFWGPLFSRVKSRDLAPWLSPHLDSLHIFRMDNRFQQHRRFPLPYGPEDRVTTLAFSSDGRFLAIGYGDGADIWDVEDGARTSPVSTTRKLHDRAHPALKCLAWIPREPRLVLTHCRGIIYTINVNSIRKKFATAGIRVDGFYEDGVSIAAMDQGFVVAFTKTVQVFELQPGSEGTHIH